MAHSGLEKLVKFGKCLIQASLFAGLTSLAGCDSDVTPKYNSDAKNMPNPAQVEVGIDDDIRVRADERETASEKETESEKERMQRYFPLNAGNKWIYSKVVGSGAEVCCYSEQTIEEPGWSSPPKGTVYFTIGKTNVIKKMLQSSEETYTITGKAEGILWNIQVDGDNPRDGRYFGTTEQVQDRNVRWGYVGRGMWEVMDGEYADAKTRNQTWMVVLEPDVVISPPTEEESPRWMIGAEMYDKQIKVPAGTFSNCLRNIVAVNCGVQFQELLRNDMLQNLRKKEGESFGFATESFFAKDVGLVKEVQYDANGNEAYRLELMKYDIK